VSIDRVSDADLVRRARQGDTAAFGELVNRHQSAVYRAAMAALGSHADAEDAAQDAFLAAYRRLAGFRGDSSFKTWLLTITWHHAINRRRSVTRLWRRIAQPAANPEVESPLEHAAAAGPTPEEAVADLELQDAIRHAIRALSPKMRDALLLARAGEYTYEEIGAMLNAPVGTIKWRVSEARRSVRKHLLARGYENVGGQ
jgi:RNA polymerase sigma-70 factor (ECF subfamily)